jgi:hypothetical protein
VDISKLVAAVHAEHGVSLDKDDPALQLATILRVVQDEARAEYRAEAEELRQALAEAIAGARVLSPEGEASFIDRVGGRFIVAADERAAKLARAYNWRTVTLAALALVAAVVVAGVGGWWKGVDDGRAEAAAAATDLRSAFSAGGDEAMAWRDLMTFNQGHIKQAVSNCRPIPTTTGQQACEVPLWTGPKPVAGAKR